METKANEQMPEEIGMIYKTFDYGIFKTPFNRDLNERNVRAIMDNVKENGQAITPIKLTRALEVADGQHRLEAFKRLGLPVYYFVDNTKFTLKPEHLLSENNVSIKWSTIDYIKMKVKQGDENYVKLYEVMEKTKLPFWITSVILSICGGCINRNFTKGGYIYNEEHGEALVFYNNIANSFTFKMANNTLRSVLMLYRKCTVLDYFDGERYIDAINQNPARILGLAKIYQVGLAMNEIYNLKLGEKNRISFISLSKRSMRSVVKIQNRRAA